jgi:hypothetical protein
MSSRFFEIKSMTFFFLWTGNLKVNFNINRNSNWMLQDDVWITSHEPNQFFMGPSWPTVWCVLAECWCMLMNQICQSLGTKKP